MTRSSGNIPYYEGWRYHNPCTPFGVSPSRPPHNLPRNRLFALKKTTLKIQPSVRRRLSGYHRVPEILPGWRSLQGLCAFLDDRYFGNSLRKLLTRSSGNIPYYEGWRYHNPCTPFGVSPSRPPHNLPRNRLFALKKTTLKIQPSVRRRLSGYHRVPEILPGWRSLQGLCAFLTAWLFRMNETIRRFNHDTRVQTLLATTYP